MSYGIHYENAIANHGSWARLEALMGRAEAGERLTIGFIGGSITQGSVASDGKLCYAWRVFRWWEEHFPKSEFVYINAGIGGTTSHFGAARVEEDLLAHKPDFVIVEFSVNDESDGHFLETYEGLVRRIYGSGTRPAVVLVHNVYYHNGANAQLQHAKVGRHYGLPCVSMQSSIYPEVVAGRIPNREITPDDLHPNDEGHALVASVIMYFLDQVREGVARAHSVGDGRGEEDSGERGCGPGASCQEDGLGADQSAEQERRSAGAGQEYRPSAGLRVEGISGRESGTGSGQPEQPLPEPLTLNTYEAAYRVDNRSGHPTLRGFVPDGRPRQGVADCFRNGWTADGEGASIEFVVRGSGIAVQYRRSVAGPAPIARVVVDGDEEHAVTLDANFDEDWGDLLALATVTEHTGDREHTVVVTVTEADGCVVPFYLASLIVAR